MQRAVESVTPYCRPCAVLIPTADQGGNTIEKYDYSVYGRVQIAKPNGERCEVSIVANPYYFTGRRLDTETALYYYRARYYSPRLGRFLQTDPIGYADGLNMYAYCRNNPLAFSDPSGLCGEGQAWAVMQQLYPMETARVDYYRVFRGTGMGRVSSAVETEMMMLGKYIGFSTLLEGIMGVDVRNVRLTNGLERDAQILSGSVQTTISAIALAEGLHVATSSHVVGNPSPNVANLNSHVIKRMEQRGWTAKEIREAARSGKSFPAVDRTAGGQPATRFVHPRTGKSVVVNNQTGNVVHVGGEGFDY